MPTFQTIRIHPDLHKRLVTEDAAVIETPQALLSRHPAQIRLWDPSNKSCQAISRTQIHQLRQEVAHALISHRKPSVGCSSLPAQSNNEDDEPLHQHNLPGTQTALQLLVGNPPLQYLSTGCSALDQLLAFPVEYYTLSTRINPNTTPTTTIPAGLAHGYVTQLTGPPGCGKTQLALQVAATATAVRNTNNNSSEGSSCSNRCWYLSTNPSVQLYAQRLQELGRSFSPNSTSCHLEAVQFWTVTNEYQLLQALAQLEDQAAAATDTKHPALLVVDSLSSIAFVDNRMEATVGITLKRLARTYGWVVLVIGGSAKEITATAAHVSCSLAALQQTIIAGTVSNRLQMRLDKHPTQKPGTVIDLILSSKGIQAAAM